MKNYFFSAFIFIVLISCGRKSTSVIIQKNYWQFKTGELIADNISEEITGNDELQLLIYHVKDTIPHNILLSEWIDTMMCNKSKNELKKYIDYKLSNSNFPSNPTRLIFILLELDTPTSSVERVMKIREIMIKGNYRFYDSLHTDIKRLIFDDDILGIKFQTLSELYKNQKGSIVFSGINLFDKYYYRLTYEWE